MRHDPLRPTDLLQPHHLDYLEKRAVTKPTVQVGFGSNLDPRKELGYDHYGQPGLYISTWDYATGDISEDYCQYRLDSPRNEQIRYLSPKKPVRPLLVGTQTAWAECDTDYLIVTEGSAKAGCLLSNNVYAIALAGVAGWGTGKGNKREIHPLLRQIIEVESFNRVYLWFDRDLHTKSAVFHELKLLANALKTIGVPTLIIDHCSFSQEKGLDDFLATHPIEKRRKLIEALVDSAKSIEEITLERIASNEYTYYQEEDRHNICVWFLNKFNERYGDIYLVGNSKYLVKDKQVKEVTDHALKGYALELMTECTLVSKAGTFPNLDMAKYLNIILAAVRSKVNHVLDIDCVDIKELTYFQDCIYDIENDEYREYDDSELFNQRLAINAPIGEPDYLLPELLKFLIDRYGTSQIPLIRAVAAAFLDRTAIYGWFLHIQGQSGSGKGSLMSLFDNILGPRISSLDRFNFLGEPEKIAQFANQKSLYKIGDNQTFQNGLGMFFELCDNAPATSRRLYYSKSETTRLNIRFAILSTDAVKVEGEGEGWVRRVRMLQTQPKDSCKLNRQDFVAIQQPQQIANFTAWAQKWNRRSYRELRDKILADWRDYIINNTQEVSIHFPDFEINLEDSPKPPELTGEPVTDFIVQCIILIDDVHTADPKTIASRSITFAQLFEYFKIWANYCQVGTKISVSSFRHRVERHLGGLKRKGQHLRSDTHVGYLPQHFYGVTIDPNLFRDQQFNPDYLLPESAFPQVQLFAKQQHEKNPNFD